MAEVLYCICTFLLGYYILLYDYTGYVVMRNLFLLVLTIMTIVFVVKYYDEY